MFMHLKEHAASHMLHEEEEMGNKDTVWLRAHAAVLFNIGIQKLISRLNKFLDKGNEYVKK
jgi:hypothetical protein